MQQQCNLIRIISRTLDVYSVTSKLFVLAFCHRVAQGQPQRRCYDTTPSYAISITERRGVHLSLPLNCMYHMHPKAIATCWLQMLQLEQLGFEPGFMQASCTVLICTACMCTIAADMT